jgi:hypothetical protein
MAARCGSIGLLRTNVTHRSGYALKSLCFRF